MSGASSAKPSRRKSCEHPSCPKQPAFSYNGSGVRFCAQHRLKGMVNVRNRRCEGADCTKEPYFGEKGGKARFCASHKPSFDMVDVRHRRCEHVSCHKQPNYGYEGQRACFCSTHKLPTMVDVKHRRCAEPGCRGYSSFAFPGSKEKFCTAHRREGMQASGRGRTSASSSGAALATALPPSTSRGATSASARSVTPPQRHDVARPAATKTDNAVAPIVVGVVPPDGDGLHALPSRRSASDEEGESIDAEEPRSGRRRHKRRSSTGSPFRRRGGERPDSGHERRHGDEPGMDRMDVDGVGGNGRNRYRREEENMEQDSFELRRRSCPADFGFAAAAYVAKQRRLHDQGIDETVRSVPRPNSAGGGQTRDDLSSTYNSASLPSRMQTRCLPSWRPSSALGMSSSRASSYTRMSRSRAPLASDVCGNTVLVDGDAGTRRAESLEGYTTGSSSGCGDAGSVSGGDCADDVRGGYPATGSASSSGGGGAAVSNTSFGSGVPRGDGRGGLTVDFDSKRQFHSGAGGSYVAGVTWAEDVLRRRQLPGMERAPPAEGTAVASLNLRWRDGLPKPRSVLSPAFAWRGSSSLGYMRSSGAEWPSPDVATERVPRDAKIVDERPLSPAAISHTGRGYREKAGTSSVYTLAGPHKRRVMYFEGAGPLGPTLEPLEPRWRADASPVLHA